MKITSHLILESVDRPDMREVGLSIYKTFNTPKIKQREFQGIIPDKLYSPSEVAHILSVSYNSALSLMERTSKTVDLAKPRTRKRLLRIKGKHLREYLEGKL